MKKLLFILFIFYSFSAISEDKEIITLHEGLVDKSLIDELGINEKNKLIDQSYQIDQNTITSDNNQELTSTNVNEVGNILTDEILISSLWNNSNKEDINFLFDNISLIKSNALKKEILSFLNINDVPPLNFQKIDFENFIIKNLLKFGERNKAYDVVKNIYTTDNLNYKNFYKEFELNYLLLTYNLSEACEFRENLKEFDQSTNNTLLFKVDIFCLLLEERFDEASLLNSLLMESNDGDNEYFNLLYEGLVNNNIQLKNLSKIKINANEIFLYSAMHRVGNIPLSEKFLEIDPINLSMPIVLSNSTEIELRLKAANKAYLSNILNIDTLSALYQMVDFSSLELSNKNEAEKKIKNNIELSMAYYFQLINVQLLSAPRLEALVIFWNFAKENDLEKISYALSKKILDTINPANELIDYGIDILNAYIKIGDFENAQKWINFIESSYNDDIDMEKLQSSKLLYNLYNIKNSEEFKFVLIASLLELGNFNKQVDLYKNEILYVIFSVLDETKLNPFQFQRSTDEYRLLPSSYLMYKIRKSSLNNNNAELVLSILASINNKNWKEVHPEHLLLILNSISKYKSGIILNELILEILEQTKII